MIFFVTPAWQRYELTRVVLEQRRRVMDFMEDRGVPARQVVIADDRNARTAAELGMDVYRKPNYALGRRFNDGIQYAAKQGAEWIVPIGSDSFLDPAYLFPLPEPGVMRSSHFYTLAEPGRLGQCRVRIRSGAGPYVIPRAVLPSTLRPARDVLKRGVDSSTLKGLRSHDLEYVDLHPWQYVGWRSYPQLNAYDKLFPRIGVAEETEVLERLSEFYPRFLVERAIEACAAAREAVA